MNALWVSEIGQQPQPAVAVSVLFRILLERLWHFSSSDMLESARHAAKQRRAPLKCLSLDHMSSTRSSHSARHPSAQAVSEVSPPWFHTLVTVQCSLCSLTCCLFCYWLGCPHCMPLALCSPRAKRKHIAHHGALCSIIISRPAASHAASGATGWGPC